MGKKIGNEFFERDARIVARELLGKIFVRVIDGKELRSKIVETEAYLDENDPGSRARQGKTKISEMMWEKAGSILVYNVHKYHMFNIITGEKGNPEAVLIRAGEPLDFEGRLSGPGLFSIGKKLDKTFHGKHIREIESFWLEYPDGKENFEITGAHRIGLKEDSEEKLRFYIKDNKHISKK